MSNVEDKKKIRSHAYKRNLFITIQAKRLYCRESFTERVGPRVLGLIFEHGSTKRRVSVTPIGKNPGFIRKTFLFIVQFDSHFHRC